MQQTSENPREAYLTSKDLAHRWSVTLHTLEQWRWKGRGPHFFKVGSCIRYPKAEIERFETHFTQTPLLDVMDKRFLCIDLEFFMSTDAKTQESTNSTEQVEEDKE